MTKNADALLAEPVEAARKGRKNNPEKTREDILQAAVAEFVDQGLSGARVDAIAERTKTSKRMIYYYFGSKEQLYQAVLEKLYAAIRNTEHGLPLHELEPQEAIRRLVEFTFDYHDRNVDFVRTVSIENIHYAQFVSQSESIRSMSDRIRATLGELLERGVATGVFKANLDPTDVHLLMSAFCFYRVSNRHTFGSIFQIDLQDVEVKLRHKQMICEAVLGYLRR
ncbi:TetR/AcrR family transcriptional regulator [Pseudomonas sp. LRF_L74]|uniref:TetR/AcrR family transcriptional regulator n=1 Tax=Pseudomonas sp. LRF_L74 TaxID=3369422 RepID=UPI003F60E852